MEQLFTADQLRSLDRRAVRLLGLPSVVFMERAGSEAARVVVERFGLNYRVCVCCGPGGNGGDGYVVARHLALAGCAVTVCVVAEPTRDDTAAMLAAARAVGIKDGILADASLVVDALFGTGGRIEQHPQEAALMAVTVPIVALDAPSFPGLTAELTIAFHGRQIATAVEPGRSRAGTVVTVPVSFPPADGVVSAWLYELADLGELPRRSATGSKYDAGAVLVIGGAAGMAGAPALCAIAALRSGAGVVWVAVPESERRTVATLAPEIMVISHDEIDSVLLKADAVVCGPGLGRGEVQARIVRGLVRDVSVPLLIDADGLAPFSGRPQELAERGLPLALTPHAGELARLIGIPAVVDRVAAVTEAAEITRAAVLLKGPDTIVAARSEPLRVVNVPVPELATAGSGDVLAGVCGALLARGVAPAEALALGAVAHGEAARNAVDEHGLIVASDLLSPIARVLA